MTNQVARKKRHKKIRSRVIGSPSKRRLSVFRSLTNIYAQLIDDQNGVVLAQASSIKSKDKMTKTQSAQKVGEELAKKASEKKISECVFDRAGYKFHGRVKALAEAARENGLKF